RQAPRERADAPAADCRRLSPGRRDAARPAGRSRSLRAARPRLAKGRVVTEARTTSAGRRYLAEAGRLVDRLAAAEWPNLDAAAALVADALARGGEIHAF